MKGLVVKSTGSWYKVRTEDGAYWECRIKGKFRIKGIRSTNPIAVGDWVSLDELQDGTAVITEIDERKNYIIRKSVNLSKKSHILASNVDQAMLIVTLAYPPTSMGFIDRFLVSAEAYKIPTIIVFNKVDLYDEEQLELMDSYFLTYQGAGYQTIEVSAVEGFQIDRIREMMKGKVSILSGHSGVGKSTLINAVDPNLDLRTGDISDYHLSGMHTTTFAEMFELQFDGYIIDTPGIKGFGLVDIEKEELASYFPDIWKYASSCKFHNCMHVKEPKCAVKNAVDEFLIFPSRYESYLSMLEDTDGPNYRETLYPK